MTFLLKRCHMVNCNKESEMRCKACKFGYCSVDHQRENWPDHKEMCRKISHYRSLFFNKFDPNLLSTLVSKEPEKVMEPLYRVFKENEGFKNFVEGVKDDKGDHFKNLLQNSDLMDDYALSVVIYQMCNCLEDLKNEKGLEDEAAEMAENEGRDDDDIRSDEESLDSMINESKKNKEKRFMLQKMLLEEEKKNRAAPRPSKKKKKKKKKKQKKKPKKKKPVKKETRQQVQPQDVKKDPLKNEPVVQPGKDKEVEEPEKTVEQEPQEDGGIEEEDISNKVDEVVEDEKKGEGEEKEPEIVEMSEEKERCKRLLEQIAEEEKWREKFEIEIKAMFEKIRKEFYEAIKDTEKKVSSLIKVTASVEEMKEENNVQ